MFELEEDALPNAEATTSYTEEGLQELLASMTTWSEKNHGAHAVHIVTQARIFDDCSGVASWDVDFSRNPISNVTSGSLQQLLTWKSQMDADINRQNGEMEGPSLTGNDGQTNDANTECLHGDGSEDQGEVTHYDPDAVPTFARSGADLETSENSIPPVDPSQLKTDQRRAYDIVIWHLDQTLSGNDPPPLRMILHGEGGTGKSKVIQTITQAFAQRNVGFMLLKAAYTGVAASLIDGKTTHTIGMISRNGRPLSSESKAKLQAFWKNYEYLIIDEFSMISKTFLAKLSKNIGIGKARGNAEDPEASQVADS